MFFELGGRVGVLARKRQDGRRAVEGVEEEAGLPRGADVADQAAVVQSGGEALAPALGRQGLLVVEQPLPERGDALGPGALGVAGIVFLVLAAVAPLTGIVVVASLAIALGNGGGTPMSFFLVAAILLLFAVGYAQMSKQLVNAGGFYAFVVKGLGRTGGLVAGLLTAVPGSSAVVERGFVTYSNEAKTELLGVPAGLIATHGAVSEPVARAMAQGAVAQSQAQVSVAVTGVAGPDGGSAAKPVGTVWFGWNVNGNITTATRRFDGDRAAVRQQTLAWACARLNALLQTPPHAPR